MRRVFLAMLALAATAAPADAHFLWVVPDITGGTARVIVSETLSADHRVDIDIMKGATLVWRDAKGQETPLAPQRTGIVMTLPLQAPTGIVRGHADLGVRPSNERAYRLHYYPKTIVGKPFEVTIGSNRPPIEIVPVGAPGAMRLRVLVAGKPAPDVDVNVLLPDGSETTEQTDASGLTDTLTVRGRYGAWARHFEQIGGTLGDKAFDHTRHYATLVFDTEAGAASTAAPATVPVATKVATMPEAASSFGAVASDGWLYLYGGHVVKTHSYSTEAVSGRFNRLNLRDLTTWEALPSGPPLQGMNLAAYDRTVLRVGGMQPFNKPGEPSKIVSMADVARFDAKKGAWETLPSLPTPLSSHDIAVVGHQLFVIGGWTLKSGEKTTWPTTMSVLDLSAEQLAWKTLPQPFARRAFIAAATDDKIFVLGGFDEKDSVLRGTSIYDVARGTWSDGPALPGGMMNGFGPAAAIVNGRLVISIDNGGIYRLDGTATGWEQLGKATPRIVHRLTPIGNGVLVIGGAGDDDNSNAIERLTFQ